MARILVCGGRRYTDMAHVTRVLDALDPPPTLIIHGGASGADACAADWAMRRGITTHVYPADWQRYGRGAGPIRNHRMLDEGRPDLVIAFPGGTGTADMVRRARINRVPVIEAR